MHDTITDWLVLLHAANQAGFNIYPLLDVVSSPGELLLALTTEQRIRQALPERLLARLANPDQRAISLDREWLEIPGNTFIHCQDSAYPPMLRQIAAPPLGLYVRGDAALLQRDQVAVVGSRKPSRYGREAARKFAAELAAAGMVITSGLASGIDSIAHEAALSRGVTQAVLGHGFNYLYPARNRPLADEICRAGVLVSEFPVATRPLPVNFPRRNRIISGCSRGTLVVEAALKSGSLITARHALEQNRDVFALPGSINNPLAAGCHDLIQQGAKLVQDVEDILLELGIKPVQSARQNNTNGLSQYKKNKLDVIEKKLLDNIGYDPVTLDELYLVTDINVDTLSCKLLKLELEGHVSAISPGVYIRN